MARILLIETSPAQLSVALSENGRVTASRESHEPRSHAAMTAPFVQALLAERGLTVKDCDAVCVSKGPGSYTGLRVGVSTAKGLCFGAGIPLLAVGTLELLVAQARADKLIPEGCRCVVPMIDARRMEVYAARFTPEGEQLSPVEPRIIDADAYADALAEGPVLFIGDGADKCRTLLSSPNAHFAGGYPQAAAMAPLAEAAYHEKKFEDLAYFEPFYLKEFIATVSRKNPLEL